MDKKEMSGFKRAQALAEVRAKEEAFDRKMGETVLIRSWIESKVLETEPDLQSMAWVGYRYMSPLERTELFAKEYIQAYLTEYAKQHPEEDINKKRPINSVFAANDLGVINALWNARAFADALGVPYDVYLKAVMGGHMVNDKWNQPPRPNQLYGKLVEPRLRGALVSATTTDRLYGADWNNRFFAEAYRGDPVQDTALQMLQDMVSKSTNPAKALSVYMCERKAITVERAKAIFGDELVNDARQLSEELPIETSSPQGRYVPACFAYPDKDESSVCGVCPARAQCFQFSDSVRTEMMNTLGTDDPRDERRKKQNKDRQRRHRNEIKRAESKPPDGASSQPFRDFKYREKELSAKIRGMRDNEEGPEA